MISLNITPSAARRATSHGQFEFFVKVKLLTAQELFHGSQQMTVRTILWVFQNLPTVYLQCFTNRHMRTGISMQQSDVLNSMLQFSQCLTVFPVNFLFLEPLLVLLLWPNGLVTDFLFLLSWCKLFRFFSDLL